MNQQTSGTIGGTLLTIVGVLDLQDIFKTIILAAIGALVSFIVSTGLKIIFKHPTFLTLTNILFKIPKGNTIRIPSLTLTKVRAQFT